jgi:tetratricopeptide (TPR) repeat protein
MFTSGNAGITCDEVLHYNQSQDVYSFFSTGGVDKDALHNPVWHLMYYGQSYDNFVTILINWLGIDNVYGFRHIMSSIAGWLTIMVTAFFAIRISGYRAALLVLLLFSLTPSFIGHSYNNLKDIPFALGYISATFLLFKFLSCRERIPFYIVFLLTLSVAFTMSIRAAGAVVILYMFFFMFITIAMKYYADRNITRKEIIYKFLLLTCISLTAYFLSIMLWPYALQNPLRNVFEAYRVMAHYPDTFRQIFEGKVEWSDFMPWYYLPKSMMITIPVIVTAGIFLFIILSGKIFNKDKTLAFSLLILTILFPVFFAIIQKSNLYSSWRQFLFIYPALVLLAASGFNVLYDFFPNKYPKWILTFALVLLAIHPVRYMINNPRYFYLYYNQIVGGLKGAHGNYETDYYYVSQTEASEWLINYLEENRITGSIKVSATYSVSWQFRNHPDIETSYFRYEERSQADWDYAIVTNRYISPFKLRNGSWPPANAIKVIYADSVPICAVLERKSKDDYYGFISLSEGRYAESVKFFEKALISDGSDEMIFFNFAAALYNTGEKQKADSILKVSLKVNPDFELSMMYLGNIAGSENRKNDAKNYYERVIELNRKYFEAYVELAGLIGEQDIMKTRRLLRTCLTMNPGFRPALVALADTYRKSNPEVAAKYDKLADSVK